MSAKSFYATSVLHGNDQLRATRQQRSKFFSGVRRIAVLSFVLVLSAGVLKARAQSTPIPSATPYVAINAGGPAVGTFIADGFFGDVNGGSSGATYATTSAVSTAGVANAAPAAVYQTERYGQPITTTGLSTLIYTIGTGTAPGVPVRVRLHFAEIWFKAQGKRKFNVDINGSRVLTEFDIVAAAGGANKAVVREFSASTASSRGSGTVTIRLEQGSANNPKISGIEILPANYVRQTVLTTQTPALDNAQDGRPYELGMKFKTNVAGDILAIRFWKPSNETGTHVGNIWSASGELLRSVTFTNETASGWQQAALPTPLRISANTVYTVSVNVNTHYPFTGSGLSAPIVNGNISSVADGNNGVYGNIGTFPTYSYFNANYFRDIVFSPDLSVAPST